MGIIEAELFSMFIVIAVLFDRRNGSSSKAKILFPSFTTLLIVYLIFLVSGIVVHSGDTAVLNFPLSLLEVLYSLHSIAYLVFLLLWMVYIEKDFVTATVKRRLMRAQSVPLLLFIILSLVNLGQVSTGGSTTFFELGSIVRFSLLNLIAALYCVVALVIIGIKWKQIDRSYHLVYLLTPTLVLITIVLFFIFVEHVVFTISTSLLLLIAHLLSQHRRIEVDLLTAVGNYQGYLRHLDSILRRRAERTLIVIDIENFQFINQYYGQSRGDEVLRQFAAFVKQLDTQADVYRVGGNRFVLSMLLINNQHVVRVVKKIQIRVAKGWEVDSVLVAFHVHIGILEVPRYGDSVGQILETVEFLVNELKSRRKYSVQIYNNALTKVRQRRLDIITVIRRAIVKKDMVKIFYQPLYAASNGRMTGAEALMRIEDSEMGLIMPGEFIPLAESSGLMNSLTLVVLEKVCDFMHENRSKFSHIDYVSINITTEDLFSSEQVARMLRIISATEVDPRRICFEVTESIMASSFEDMRQRWNQFAQLGVRLALDDFGTGYANLESLINLPFNIVKIDRSVVSNATNNFELLMMISLVLERLGKQIVAEGVETQEQLSHVQAAGIEIVQGYYFSKPVPEKQFLDLVRFDNAR